MIKFLDSVAMVTIYSGSCISYFSSKVSISHLLNSIQYGISLQCDVLVEGYIFMASLADNRAIECILCHFTGFPTR